MPTPNIPTDATAQGRSAVQGDPLPMFKCRKCGRESERGYPLLICPNGCRKIRLYNHRIAAPDDWLCNTEGCDPTGGNSDLPNVIAFCEAVDAAQGWMCLVQDAVVCAIDGCNGFMRWDTARYRLGFSSIHYYKLEPADE